MNLQDYIQIAFIFAVFSVGLGVVFSDMSDKGLNLNDEDIKLMKNSITTIELQKDNYDTNLGNQNVDYSPNADKNSDESVETGFGLGVLSNLFGLGGVFGGVTALVTVIFPTAMTGFILWFIGAAVSIFVLFILIEIYFAIRGNKQK